MNVIGDESAESHWFGKVFGLEAWVRHYPQAVKEEDRMNLPPLRISKTEMDSPCPFYPGKTIRETHALFLGLDTWRGQPLTVYRWWQLLPTQFNTEYLSWAVKNYGKSVNRQTCKRTWYMMVRLPFDDASKQGYATVADTLPARYRLPLLIEMLTFLMLDPVSAQALEYLQKEQTNLWSCDYHPECIGSRIILGIRRSGRWKLDQSSEKRRVAHAGYAIREISDIS